MWETMLFPCSFTVVLHIFPSYDAGISGNTLGKDGRA